jgi:ABC-type maltose transport system permease subunit
VINPNRRTIWIADAQRSFRKIESRKLMLNNAAGPLEGNLLTCVAGFVCGHCRFAFGVAGWPLLMTLPVIAIFFFAQPYFLRGVTLTGIKG